MRTQMIRTTDQSVYTQGNSIAAKKVSDLKQRVKLVNQTESAVLVSIHQNYFEDSRYAGAQVFYAPEERSERLAKEMQAKLVSILKPDSRRMAKKADGIYLMQNIDRPGILIECGFLSNPDEEFKLRDAAYQKKLCCVIASVLSNYDNDIT
jgi:N-acetylmuramoyl-L-alanine amidase